NALVADVAIAEVPEPVPAVVDQVLVVRLVLRGPKPQTEVQLLGRRRGLAEADVATSRVAAARLVAQAARHQEFTQLAGPGDLLELLPLRRAAALRAVLHDAVVLAGRLDGDPALVDVVTARLFDVDILAGLAGPDGHQRMPVIRRGDRDGVEVLVFQGL